MRNTLSTLCAIVLLALASAAAAKAPRAELTGLRLGMSEEAAHDVLEKRGTRQTE